MAEIRDSFRSSTRGWLKATSAGLATVLLGITGVAVTIGKAGEWGAWPLAMTGFALAVVLLKWIGNLATAYEVTPDRLVIRSGIVFKSIDEIELYRIKDVRLAFTLLNQWAGIGTIAITSSDETTRGGTLVMRHVPDARQRREKLRNLVDEARQKRHVREIDMVHDSF